MAPWSYGARMVLVVGLMCLVGASTYGAYSLYVVVKNRRKYKDEGFEDLSKLEDHLEKRILVLGLDGAGKSSFVANLSKVENGQSEIVPTKGFNIVCMQMEDAALNIWEVGGSEEVRKYWNNFFQDTDVVVFIVDASDNKRLPIVYDEFQKLFADDRLKDIPILVLANKQDRPEAMKPKEIEDALNFKGIPRTRQVEIRGMQIGPTKPQHRTVREAEDLMVHLAFCSWLTVPVHIASSLQERCAS